MQEYLLGIDIGSTTVKTALVDPKSVKLVYQDYQRHGALQRETTQRLLRELSDKFPSISVKPVFCGSGSKALSEALECPYMQEVVANSFSIRRFFPDTRVSIELGGQDAKVTFFYKDEESGQLSASDMRMNGSCAGGTGAFLDEVASLLNVDISALNGLAEKGTTLYDISGRCGVFAKTDIQPLLNQGVSKENLALSVFHAVAKQIIGGLSQGLEIIPPVIFEGGPLHFNPMLVKVFSERLNLDEKDLFKPDYPDTFIAFGAALANKLPSFDSKSVVLDDLAGNPAFQKKADEDVQGFLPPFFENDDQRKSFHDRHILPEVPSITRFRDKKLSVYLGIDAGSTTSKFVLLDKDDNLVAKYYGNNEGEPLYVVKDALLDMKKQFENQNTELEILGVGTTGYGEDIFAQAFGADWHCVETISHAESAIKSDPRVSFILDIGGQDMKAIFIGKGGIINGITLNEACSAGCGSFIENFASSLKIPVEDIAERAFGSNKPSKLGSRCTVFMNSSIITEQKNGKTPDDIMAGICYSIIQNVFTKVIRLSNMKSLGERIVVQGGTFRNDAVLRALEIFTGREVIRAPYPGEMGAIGVALLTKKHMNSRGQKAESSFIGWDKLKDFSFTQKGGIICPFCTNNCNRTIITFAEGDQYITGNRCERGEVIGEISNSEVKEKLKSIKKKKDGVKDLFLLREKILFAKQEHALFSPKKNIRIGIPRVLDFWSSYPFWQTFFESLGFEAVLSKPSSNALFESGLASVPSDTVCFPAKLAHGHLKDLFERKVDRIFMPIMNRMLPENSKTNSIHACAVLKGYPMVLRVSDEPYEKHGIPFDTPVFHWVDGESRKRSLINWTVTTFGLPQKIVYQAITASILSYEKVQSELESAGKELLDNLEKDQFAVVLAGRPYHSDPLINHKLSEFFTREGIAVLPIEALPGIHEANLNPVRAELTVNYHVRMFAAARKVIEDPRLELVQIISFGCGHDAVVTDEINRLFKEYSDKSLLNLKVDESDISGPLNIRVKSFVETVKSRRKKGGEVTGIIIPERSYPVKFEKKDHMKTILIPNVSWAFTQISTAAIALQGYKVAAMPLANNRAMELGKMYVHNDMCFPAQINIGEFLGVMETGKYDPDKVVLGLAKAQCDCRLAHYAMMARQAMDDAGYPQVPIVTTDTDSKDLHPGFRMNPLFELRMLWGLIMVDGLEDLRRKIRPYEAVTGTTDKVFEQAVMDICSGFEISLKISIERFEQAVELFKNIDYDRSNRKPRVFVIGEFLLNFHPTSNNNIERYLEKNGIEVIMPHLFYNMHREYLLEIDQKEEYFVSVPALKMFITKVGERYIRHVLKKVDNTVKSHPLFEERPPLAEIAQRSQHIIDKTFTSGEGWMIAGEILHNADHGVDSFLILQPFGCLPNHVTGRGLVKQIKKEKPHCQILALDYDPDTSFANIENRLQMLIINSHERERARREK